VPLSLQLSDLLHDHVYAILGRLGGVANSLTVREIVSQEADACNEEPYGAAAGEANRHPSPAEYVTRVFPVLLAKFRQG
jgi:hypothetical protein